MNNDDLDDGMLGLLWDGGFVVFLFGFFGFVVWSSVTLVLTYGWGFTSVFTMFLGFLLCVSVEVVYRRFYQ